MDVRPLTQEQRELASANIRLVRWTVARLRLPVFVERDDAEASGYIGLCRAAQSFDPARGTFATYAQAWIRKYALGAKREAMLVKVPAPLLGREATRHRTYPWARTVLDAKWFTCDHLLAPEAEEPDTGPVDRLRVAIATLQHKQREAVANFLAGRTSVELAREEGISRSGAHLRLRNAVRSLRATMA